MLIPQGMAYAMLAGLPPIYGLYAATIPLLIYALLGTSRQLSVGPTALVALLVSDGVGQLAQAGSAEYISLAILLALMVGVIQFVIGSMRLGFLVNFLSHPVVVGFTSAAAFIIGVSQLKHLMGITIERGSVFQTLGQLGSNIGEINMPTFILGSVAILLLLAIKKWAKKIPGPLVVVVLSLLVVYFFKLKDLGVKIVGEIPSGLDIFQPPRWQWAEMKDLIAPAIAISFLGFMQSIAMAKMVRSNHKDYELRPNQELMALGIANIAGSFFKSFPVTGGFSRTAVNDQSGAKTTLASIIAACLVILTLLFFTPYFYYLPKAILAAIILVAVFGLVKVKDIQHLWKTDKVDFILFLITALCTLFVGIEEGIMIGIGVSLLLLVNSVAYPQITILGQLPGTEEYRSVERFPDSIEHPGILILRFDAQLMFANFSVLKNFIEKSITKDPSIKHLVFDAKTINHMDSTAANELKEMLESLIKAGIDLHLSEVNGKVRDKLALNNIIDLVGADHFHLSVSEAVSAIEQKDYQRNKDYATQSNIKS